MNASGSRIETTNAVVEAGWIDEHVLVGATHLDPMFVIGDVVAAHDTDETAVLFGYPSLDRHG